MASPIKTDVVAITSLKTVDDADVVCCDTTETDGDDVFATVVERPIRSTQVVRSSSTGAAQILCVTSSFSG